MRRKGLIATAAVAALMIMMITALVVIAGCDEDAVDQSRNFRGVSDWGDGSGCLDDSDSDGGCLQADCLGGSDCAEVDCYSADYSACDGVCPGGDEFLGTFQESEPICF